MSQDCSFSAGASRLDPVDLTNEAFYIPPKYTSTNMSQGRRQSSSIKSPSEQHQRLTDEFHTIGLGTSDVQVRIASANSGETEGTPMRSNFDTEADPQTKLSKQQNFAGLVEENERLLRILAETQSELEASKKEGVKMQKTLSKGLPPRPSNNGDLRQELDEARLLLEERTTELHSAQLYLTKADIHSDVDCAALVESLNIDIMQVTAIIADDASSACPRPFPQTDFKRIQRAEKKISACQLLGADLKVSLMSLARRARSQVDPSVSIQFALQALLVEMSFRIITSWDWLHPNDQQLDALYQKICDAGKQFTCTYSQDKLTLKLYRRVYACFWQVEITDPQTIETVALGHERASSKAFHKHGRLCFMGIRMVRRARERTSAFANLLGAM